MHTKRKRGQFTPSTFSRYRQTPNNLKRANAHAIWRELSTSVLDYSLEILPISENKNLKVDIHPICPNVVISSQPIGITVLFCSTIFRFKQLRLNVIVQ